MFNKDKSDASNIKTFSMYYRKFEVGLLYGAIV